jgi:hypothetical protein
MPTIMRLDFFAANRIALSEVWQMTAATSRSAQGNK